MTTTKEQYRALLDHKEAADYFGVSERTLHRMYDVPRIRLRGCVRYRLEDLERFAEEQIESAR